MAISRQRKEELLAQYMELLEKSEAIFLTEYKGLSVPDMEKLREDVANADGAFHVTKNTLFKRALEEVDKPVPDDLLLGQLATGFALAEAPSLAKALVNYAKDQDNLVIKGGFLGDEFLTVEQVESLAKLPTLEELRAQLLGVLNAPARNVASVVASGVRQVVNVLDAYAKSEEEVAAE